MCNNGGTEFTALQQSSVIHQTFEVVGHGTGANRALHSLNDEIGGLGPADMSEHHLSR